MSTGILFGDKLQTRLEKHMRDAGFVLVTYDKQPFEYLKYERPNQKSDLPDMISFHSVDYPFETAIKATAATGDELQGFSLKTLKELLPEYPSLALDEHDQWSYSNDKELHECLDAIVDLVSRHLFAWFNNPVNNPAGMDMRPIQELTDDQLKTKLLEGLRLSEVALEKAIQEGRTEDIERHRRSIKEYRLMLGKSDA